MPLPRHTLRSAPLVLAALGLAGSIRWIGGPSESIATYTDPATGERTPVMLDAYKDHLWRRHGRSELEPFVYARLLVSEARRLGVQPAGDVDAMVDAEWRAFVDVRFGGDETAALAELVERGLSEEHFRSNAADRLLVQQHEDALILATREVADEDLRAAFDRTFGVDGVRVEVRHVWLARARVEQELLRAGRRPDELTGGAVGIEIDRRLAALAEELAAGADFGELAARASHDLASMRAGGRLANYNYDRFGPEFAAAVRQSEVGDVRRALTPNGGHLFVVDSRTRTRFEDVRDALAAELAVAEPTSLERSALRRRLIDGSDLDRFERPRRDD